MRRKKINSQLLHQEIRARKDGYRLIAGIDEAGRGPLAGPVVAASVVLRCYKFHSRIDDSKRLSRIARESAYREIIQKAFVGVGIVPEGIIDSINIYKATMLAMGMSVLNLHIRPDLLIIDGNIKLRIETDQISLVGGDRKSLSVACASIIAKVTRDRLMEFYDSIFPGYGLGKHKGYGTLQHVDEIRHKGVSVLHRRSFRLGYAIGE